ncbi:MAG: SDR family NAD(P)-dependent oxidoreductase [bacterium]|nr:SDR family NAD(P)-dependent oxidoreductase [bacterium]
MRLLGVGLRRSKQLRWERALVTGAASGIGKALAEQLASAGVKLVLVDKRAGVADVAAGLGTEILIADLCDPLELAQVEQRIWSEDAPVDLVINNAGLGYERPFGQQDAAEVDETIGLNVTALTRLTHAAIGALTTRDGGQVVLVSSMAGLQPLPSVAVYAATKAYVSSLGEALYEEQKGSSVQVTTVLPGLTHTNFHLQGGWNLDNWPATGWQDADEVAQQILKAAVRRQPQAVTGWRNRLLAFASTKAPHRIRRIALGRAARRRWQ